MAAHTNSRALGAVHHDRRVPPDPGPVAALDILVAGEPWLQFGRDGVHVVGRGEGRNGHSLFASALEQPQHQVAGPCRALPFQQLVEGLQPFGGLVGIDIGQVGRDAFADHPYPVGFGCGAGVLGQVLARELGGQLPLLGRRCRSLTTSIVHLSCPTCTAGGAYWNEPPIRPPKPVTSADCADGRADRVVAAADRRAGGRQPGRPRHDHRRVHLRHRGLADGQCHGRHPSTERPFRHRWRSRPRRPVPASRSARSR